MYSVFTRFVIPELLSLWKKIVCVDTGECTYRERKWGSGGVDGRWRMEWSLVLLLFVLSDKE